MEPVIVFINSSASMFNGWLINYVRNDFQVRFPEYQWLWTWVDDDDLEDMGEPPMYGDMVSIYDKGQRILKENGAFSGSDSHVIWMQFRIPPLARERLEIQGTCECDPKDIVYFVTLLDSIAQRWPEARGEVETYISSVASIEATDSILPSTARTGAPGSLPPVTDPTDIKILRLVTQDPDLTDIQIGAKLGLSRQAVNNRRRHLKKLGYAVR